MQIEGGPSMSLHATSDGSSDRVVRVIQMIFITGVLVLLLESYNQTGTSGPPAANPSSSTSRPASQPPAGGAGGTSATPAYATSSGQPQGRPRRVATQSAQRPAMQRSRVVLGNSTNAPPRPSRTNRSQGDVVGVWICRDVQTQRRVKTVELNDDSSYIEHVPMGSSAENVVPGNYRYDGRELSFVYIHNNGREDLLESGRVEWLDDNSFQYTQTRGYQSRNRTYLFER
jgi:hypothetical protein